MSSKDNSLLQQVLTNEHVITMAGNTLREELANQETDEKELLSAEYELKMTRSKAKEIMENEKIVLHPWSLYSLKKKKAPGFLELTFSEDDEDEEYNPEKDQCKITPYYSQIKDMECTSASSMTGPDDEKDEEEAEEQMASRTRSKFSLTEKSLTELEANFIDPDITADMYNTECDDKQWKEFLFAIHKSDEESPADQDDEEDPEYNYLEDAKKEVCDEEDFQSDRDVQVSKKELNDLMVEIIAVYEDDADEDADMVPASRTKPMIQFQTKMLHYRANDENTPEDGIDEMTEI